MISFLVIVRVWGGVGLGVVSVPISVLYVVCVVFDVVFRLLLCSIVDVDGSVSVSGGVSGLSVDRFCEVISD